MSDPALDGRRADDGSRRIAERIPNLVPFRRSASRKASRTDDDTPRAFARDIARAGDLNETDGETDAASARAWRVPSFLIVMVAVALTASVLLIAARAMQNGVLEDALVLVLATSQLVLLAVVIGRERASGARLAALRGHLTRSREGYRRALAIVEAEPQAVIVWSGGRRPEVFGNPDLIVRLGGLTRIAGFGNWAAPAGAARLEHAVEALRERGEAFAITVPLRRDGEGRIIEASGEVRSAQAILRLRDGTEDAQARAAAERTTQDYERRVQTFLSLLDAMPTPIWRRDEAGAVVWANDAYALALGETDEADDADDAVPELFGEAVRRRLALQRAKERPFAERVPVVVDGKRRDLDVHEIPVDGGAIGVALDATEAEQARADLRRHLESQTATFNQLRSGVAMFGPDQRLMFHNEAYRTLFGLDEAWLARSPQDGEILERLREADRLPHESDFKSWKRAQLDIYRSIEPRESWWHLPDRRIVRVVAVPAAEGGALYLFEDNTERVDLETRVNALARAQGETVDNLREGVAVFGSNGRLTLSNPSFRELWGLAFEEGETPHVNILAAKLAERGTEGDWTTVRAMVLEMDARDPKGGRMMRPDGTALDYLVQPLPDGATLVTFSDVTDSLSAARALEDKNRALVEADDLKNTFVQHVSYELRTPLTHIIGFSQLLASEQMGVLNDRQRDYADNIFDSSNALLTIINGILDLATIDAGAMSIETRPTDIRDVVEKTIEGLRDRMREDEIGLRLSIASDARMVEADPDRLRQVLYNLLVNAIDATEPQGKVSLRVTRDEGAEESGAEDGGAGADGAGGDAGEEDRAERHGPRIRFTIADEGPGLEPAELERLFERFETGGRGAGRRPGVGLGLSIVRSLVNLHGGTIETHTRPGEGVTVSVLLDEADDALTNAEPNPEPSLDMGPSVDAFAAETPSHDG